MASYYMHICVAKKINEKLNMDEVKLYVGSIAPDLSTELNELKTKSHFLDKQSGIISYQEFAQKYKEHLCDPYVMGYLIHLITDYVWFSKYVKKSILRYAEENDLDLNLQYKDLKKIILNDYSEISSYLFQNYELDVEKFLDINVEDINIVKEIDYTKINVLINKVQNKENLTNTKKYTILTEEDVANFIKFGSLDVLKVIENLT